MENAQPLVLYESSDSESSDSRDSEMDEDALLFPPNYSKWDTDEPLTLDEPAKSHKNDPLDNCGTVGEEKISDISESEAEDEEVDEVENQELQSNDRERCESHASAGSVREDDESKDRQPYKLPESLLLPGTRRLLLDVATFFSKPVNLQRPSRAVGDSTKDKTRERILCFLGYLHLIRGMPASELDETVFKNRVFIENYLDYLRGRRKLNPGTMANHVSSLLYVLKFLHRDQAPRYQGIRLIEQLQRTGTLLFNEGETQRTDSCEELKAQEKWLDWEEILECLEIQRANFEVAEGRHQKARMLMDLVLLSLYIQLPPSRCLEIRTLRLWMQKTKPFDNAFVQSNHWNVLLLCENGEIALHFHTYKTKKSRGSDITKIKADSELAWLFREFITKHRRKLLVSGGDLEQEERGYVFLNSNGHMFKGPAFTKHLQSLFFRLSGKRISCRILRSSFVTHVYSKTNCTESLKDSVAAALRHTKKQSQATYDRRTSMQRKSLACDFAEAESEIFQQSRDLPQASDATPPCTFKAGEFVAVVERSSSLKSPKVLIGQVLHFLGKGEISLLWYKRFENTANYYMVIDGNQWIEHQDSLHAIKMTPVKGKSGHFKLSTSLRCLHKAVFGKN